MSFVFDIPIKVLFGPGKLKELHNESLPGQRALLITSAGTSSIRNGSRQLVIRQLEEMGKEVLLFDQVTGNPTADMTQKAIETARDNDCDIVIGLGGGSAMDVATAVASVAPQQTGNFWDYVKTGSGGGKELKNGPLYCVQIATTAGTGSELNKIAVITNEQTHEKIGFRGFMPNLAITDPELTIEIPPELTAFQGFDALFHNIEGYLSVLCNEAAEVVELPAIRTIAKNLEAAVKDGNDMHARTQVALGSLWAGFSMSLSSNISHHTIEHSMSAYHSNLHHGAGLIILSHAYFQHHIEQHTCDQRFVELARAMGRPQASAPEEFLLALADLKDACGVQNLRMADYGIVPEEFPVLADNALASVGGIFKKDPSPVSREDIIRILQESYS